MKLLTSSREERENVASPGSSMKCKEPLIPEASPLPPKSIPCLTGQIGLGLFTLTRSSARGTGAELVPPEDTGQGQETLLDITVKGMFVVSQY